MDEEEVRKIFHERLRGLIDDTVKLLKKSMNAQAREMGIAPSTLHSYYTGSKMPRIDIAAVKSLHCHRVDKGPHLTDKVPLRHCHNRTQQPTYQAYSDLLHPHAFFASVTKQATRP